jgi:hypothetical protein
MLGVRGTFPILNDSKLQMSTVEPVPSRELHKYSYPLEMSPIWRVRQNELP